ncbi:MAG: glycosyltransferase [Nevskia sp.]|nr:glycosyltransferase [Nevskia sp.]
MARAKAVRPPRPGAAPLVVVLPSFAAGGAERVLLALANRLSGERRVHLAAIRPQGPLRGLIAPRVQVHDLGGRLLWPARLLARLHRMDAPTVLSSLWDVNLFLLGLRRLMPRSARLVLREAVAPEYSIRERPWRRRAAGLYFRWYARADAAIVLSGGTAEILAASTTLPRERIHVVANAPDPARFSGRAARRPTSGGPLRLLAAGRLAPQKGFDLLIAAMAQLLQRGLDVQLRIAGEGPERGTLESLAAGLQLQSRVTLAGYREDLADLMSEADLFVLPSRFEGQPNVLIEALMAGAPVVAMCDNTGAAEIVEAGVNGVLVAGASAEALSDAIEHAARIAGGFDRAGIAAAAARRFSFDSHVARYRELLFPADMAGT